MGYSIKGFDRGEVRLGAVAHMSARPQNGRGMWTQVVATFVTMCPPPRFTVVPILNEYTSEYTTTSHIRRSFNHTQTRPV